MKLNDKTDKILAIELIAASFIVLFQELTLIRWIASQIRVLAYFPNLILLSTFLGLGIGCLRSGKRSLLLMWPVSLLVLTIVTWFMSGIVFTSNSESEHLWLLYYDLGKEAMKFPRIDVPILIAFILSTISFVPLGQIVAERIQEFKNRRNPLMGYVYDIFGSLCGVIAFPIICLFNTFPIFWFTLFLTGGTLFFKPNKKLLGVYAALAIAVISVVGISEKSDAYSPYYALSRKPVENGTDFDVLTNGSLHQHAIDLGTATYKKDNAFHRNVYQGYHYPTVMFKQMPKSVLILGAGTGNDIATWLDEGVESIDIVEIDPQIIKWGREFHPNKPYSSHKVTVHNTDARSFLNTTDKKFDLIVFGTLDSMTRLSALSNVRLDNFVYTVEALKAARSRLTEKGGVIMYFMVGTSYIDDRLSGIHFDAFGELPLVYRKNHNLFNRIYFSGPAFYHEVDPPDLEQTRIYRDQVRKERLVSTDDWPYLYLKEKGISSFYLTIMAAILVIAFAGIFMASAEIRKGLFTKGSFDAEMFLFGLAFLLLETRSVTEMSLLWGSTWLTNAVVFGAILFMILLATLREKWKSVPLNVSAFGLIVSLLVTYVLPLQPILGQPMIFKLLFSVLSIGAPIYFASSCFAHLFAKRKSADLAFGWNLLGAVTGGLMEFLSMIIGLKALLLVALASYVSAFLINLGKSTKQINA